jgi:hypothetical protein
VHCRSATLRAIYGVARPLWRRGHCLPVGWWCHDKQRSVRHQPVYRTQSPPHPVVCSRREQLGESRRIHEPIYRYVQYSWQYYER